MNKCINCKYKKWNMNDCISYCSLWYNSGNSIITYNDNACKYYKPTFIFQNETENEINQPQTLLFENLKRCKNVVITVKDNKYLCSGLLSINFDIITFKNVTLIEPYFFDIPSVRMSFKYDDIDKFDFTFI